jgi:hypothetical protein
MHAELYKKIIPDTVGHEPLLETPLHDLPEMPYDKWYDQGRPERQHF